MIKFNGINEISRSNGSPIKFLGGTDNDFQQDYEKVEAHCLAKGKLSEANDILGYSHLVGVGGG
tara:strand:- start:1002 stop:1193 length:192 start_codon:yes stop_codon:yes gene_type:complete